MIVHRAKMMLDIVWACFGCDPVFSTPWSFCAWSQVYQLWLWVMKLHGGRMVLPSWRVVHNEKLFDLLHHKQCTQWLNQQSRFMSSTCCVTTCWSGWIAFSGKPPIARCLALIVTVSWPLCPPPSPIQLSNNTHVLKKLLWFIKRIYVKVVQATFQLYDIY